MPYDPYDEDSCSQRIANNRHIARRMPCADCGHWHLTTDYSGYSLCWPCHIRATAAANQWIADEIARKREGRNP